jgi:serine/threonine-protein kinase
MLAGRTIEAISAVRTREAIRTQGSSPYEGDDDPTLPLIARLTDDRPLLRDTLDDASQTAAVPPVAGHIELGLKAADSTFPLRCPVCRRRFRSLGDYCTEHRRLAVPTLFFSGPTTDPVLGRLLGGRYAVLEQIGQGSMGTVYRGVDAPGGRAVALKVLRPELTNDVAVEQRFLREASTLTKIAHPNLVQCHDYGVEPDRVAYMALELLPGCSLKAALRHRRLELWRTIQIADQVLRAVAAMHEAGVVHRDLKPSNIMIEHEDPNRDCVKLIDLGLARIMGPDVARLTVQGDVFGTPRYMSPEQAVGLTRAGYSADIYSFGIILWECLTGSPPFSGVSAVGVMRQHIAAPLPAFAPEDPHTRVPGALVSFLKNCLRKKPEDRPQCGTEALRAFRLAVTGLFPVTAP